MSKSKKKQHRPAQEPTLGINTLGIDVEPTESVEAENAAGEDEFVTLSEDVGLYGFELSDDDAFDDTDAQPMPVLEKITNYATLALSMLLLGGSIVFWWMIGRLLITDPDRLADSAMMAAVLICCAVIPIIVTAAQVLLRRPLTIERWLICMCISGAAAAMFVTGYQLGIRDISFGFYDYFTLLCCTVSGCTLPCALCCGLRWLIPVLSARLRAAAARRAADAADWSEVSGDVFSMTDFDL